MARKMTIDDVVSAIQDALDAAECVADYEDHEGSDDIGKDAAIDAINRIRVGDYNGAITILEREFLPKHADMAAAEAAYKRARVSCAEPREWR